MSQQISTVEFQEFREMMDRVAERMGLLVTPDILGTGCVPVKVLKLHHNAVEPHYATDGSGCFDLYSIDEANIDGARVFRTGLAFEIPRGYTMLLFSRSGMGFNNDVRLANCVGVIDSDYRGEVLVKLREDGDPMHIRYGSRIAQALIVRAPKAAIQMVEALEESTRGVGGFGSTGS